MMNLDLKLPKQRVSPRYVVDQLGRKPWPYRVFDTHKQQEIIHTADPKVAKSMAEEYERQWLRSTWWHRKWSAMKRWLRELFAPPVPIPKEAPSVRELRVEFVNTLCEKYKRPTT